MNDRQLGRASRLLRSIRKEIPDALEGQDHGRRGGGLLV